MGPNTGLQGLVARRRSCGLSCVSLKRVLDSRLEAWPLALNPKGNKIQVKSPRENQRSFLINQEAALESVVVRVQLSNGMWAQLLPKKGGYRDRMAVSSKWWVLFVVSL